MKLARILKKVIAIVIVNIFVLSLSACRNKLDIQELSIVMAMGADITEEGKYRVSYQVLSANVSHAGGEGPGGGVGVIYYEGVGDTIIDAMYRMGNKISKKLHFGQLKVLILGEILAEKGISPVIDALGRFGEVRGNLPVYLTKGEAKAIIRQKAPQDSVAANVIDDMINSQIIVGTHPVKYLAQVMNRLFGEFSVLVLGVIELPKINEEPDEAAFKMEGMAVLDKGKLIGFLDEKETLGYQFIKDNGDRATVSVKLTDGCIVVLGLTKSKCRFEAKIVEGKPKVTINIFQHSSIREMTGEIDTIKDREVMKEIASLQEEAVKRIIEDTISAAKKDVKMDFIGVGEAIYRQHPKDFEKVKEVWKDKFLDTEFKVYVNAEVRDTGLLSQPVP